MSRIIFEDMTLERFLRLPESKPALEFTGGKAVRKVAPKRLHSVIQSCLHIELMGAVRPRKLGLSYVELRCTFGGRSLVPDLCIVARGRIPKDKSGRPVGDLFLAPDLTAEVI